LAKRVHETEVSAIQFYLVDINAHAVYLPDAFVIINCEAHLDQSKT